MECYLLIQHRVREYSNWLFEFDSLLPWRQSLGEEECQVFRDNTDENIVTLLLKWKNVESANAFISDTQLSEMMQVSGVMDQPSVNILIKS